MEQDLANELQSILSPAMERLEASGPELAHYSFGNVLRDLDDGQRIREPTLTMLAQGQKYLKQSDRPEDAELHKRVAKWKQAWGKRPLPNEAIALSTAKDAVRGVAQGTAEVAVLLLEDDRSAPLKGYSYYKFFDAKSGRGVAVVTIKKKSVLFESDSADLIDRVAKGLVGAMPKDLGKPSGTAKNKKYKQGSFSLSIQRTSAPGNDAYPFPRQSLMVSVSGRSALFTSSCGAPRALWRWPLTETTAGPVRSSNP